MHDGKVCFSVSLWVFFQPTDSTDVPEEKPEDDDWTLEAKVFTKTPEGELIPVVIGAEKPETDEKPEDKEPEKKEKVCVF